MCVDSTRMPASLAWSHSRSFGHFSCSRCASVPSCPSPSLPSCPCAARSARKASQAAMPITGDRPGSSESGRLTSKAQENISVAPEVFSQTRPARPRAVDCRSAPSSQGSGGGAGCRARCTRSRFVEPVLASHCTLPKPGSDGLSAPDIVSDVCKSEWEGTDIKFKVV